MRGWRTSPASPNEARGVELSGVGQSPGSSGTSGSPEVRGADILFLSEIRMNKRKMEKFRWMLGLTNMLVREGKGKGGGFAVFWQKGVDVSLRSISDYFMDVDVKEEDGFCWRFTGVYGEAHSELKYRTWQQLCGLHVQPVKP